MEIGNAWSAGLIAAYWAKAAVEIAIKAAKTGLQWWNPAAWVDLGVYTYHTLALPAALSVAYAASKANALYYQAGVRYDDGGTPFYYRHLAEVPDATSRNLILQQFDRLWRGQGADIVTTLVTGSLWQAGTLGKVAVLGLGLVAGGVAGAIYDPLDPIKEDEVGYRNVAFVSDHDVDAIIGDQVVPRLFETFKANGFTPAGLLDGGTGAFTEGQYASLLAADVALLGDRFANQFRGSSLVQQFLAPGPTSLVWTSDRALQDVLDRTDALLSRAADALAQLEGGAALQRSLTRRIHDDLVTYDGFVVPAVMAAVAACAGQTVPWAHAHKVPAVPVEGIGAVNATYGALLYTTGAELQWLANLPARERVAWLNLKWTRLYALVALDARRHAVVNGSLDVVLTRSPRAWADQLLDLVSVDVEFAAQFRVATARTTEGVTAYSAFAQWHALHADEAGFTAIVGASAGATWQALQGELAAAQAAWERCRARYAALAGPAYAEFDPATLAAVTRDEALVLAFKERVLQLAGFTTHNPQVYAPHELVPVHQKGASHYLAVPHDLPAPALHTPAASPAARVLMRFVDLAVMRQGWVLKDVEGWAGVAATVASTALSTVASRAIRQATTPAGAAAAGRKTLVRGILANLQEIAGEAFEEVVSEPVVGEHLLATYSGLAGGAGRAVDAALAYAQLAGTPALGGPGADARLEKASAAVGTSLRGQARRAEAALRNAQAKQFLARFWANARALRDAEAWTTRARAAVRSFLGLKLAGPEALATRAPRLLDAAVATAGGLDLATQPVAWLSAAIDGALVRVPVGLDATPARLQRAFAVALAARDLRARSVTETRLLGERLDAALQEVVARMAGGLRVAVVGEHAGAPVPVQVELTADQVAGEAGSLRDLVAAAYAAELETQHELSPAEALAHVTAPGRLDQLLAGDLLVDYAGETAVALAGQVDRDPTTAIVTPTPGRDGQAGETTVTPVDAFLAPLRGGRSFQTLAEAWAVAAPGAVETRKFVDALLAACPTTGPLPVGLTRVPASLALGVTLEDLGYVDPLRSQLTPENFRISYFMRGGSGNVWDRVVPEVRTAEEMKIIFGCDFPVGGTVSRVAGGQRDVRKVIWATFFEDIDATHDIDLMGGTRLPSEDYVYDPDDPPEILINEFLLTVQQRFQAGEYDFTGTIGGAEVIFVVPESFSFPLLVALHETGHVFLDERTIAVFEDDLNTRRHPVSGEYMPEYNDVTDGLTEFIVDAAKAHDVAGYRDQLAYGSAYHFLDPHGYFTGLFDAVKSGKRLKENDLSSKRLQIYLAHLRAIAGDRNLMIEQIFEGLPADRQAEIDRLTTIFDQFLQVDDPDTAQIQELAWRVGFPGYKDGEVPFIKKT